MSMLPFSTPTSDAKSITGTSVTFDTTMVSGQQYILRGDTDLWYRISSTPSAAQVATDENHFLAKGQTGLIACSGANNKVTAIKNTGAADGAASLSLLAPVT